MRGTGFTPTPGVARAADPLLAAPAKSCGARPMGLWVEAKSGGWFHGVVLFLVSSLLRRAVQDGDFACRARHAQPMMRDRRRSASMCAAVISRGHPAEQFRRVRGNSPCLLREKGRKPPDPTQAGAKSSVPRVPRV